MVVKENIINKLLCHYLLNLEWLADRGRRAPEV